MQLYHHPYSLDSQKVRLALEEKGIDYTSYHANPITGKNLNPSFFRGNQTARIPVFQNGSHVIYDTLEIIQYIERIAVVSVGNNNFSYSNEDILHWMRKIQEWDPKYFTLSHVPEKYRQAVSKFLRRAVITRMAESPDLASAYHRQLKEAYNTEEKLRNPDVVARSKDHLARLLDEIESKLTETAYVAGNEFSMADVVFIPVLARLSLLDLEDEYIRSRASLFEYWGMVRERPSYKKVIGRYFDGWRKYRTLSKTWWSLKIRSLVNKY
ncbi:hypothetical protein MLD38_001943 [Melastoma candidum]|uniref:Uncharacterized protein n=1 Tax=Melastoma candidum TaxID=119954 RepID=A0ACB9SI56_9MYRT|nr:hypothetical protein MLD38_001943 [Melastoma candidum]